MSFNYEINPVVRRHILVNDTTQVLSGKFRIIPKSADFLNFRIPASPIIISIKPKSALNILILTKFFPEMDWGQYDTNIELMANDGRPSSNQNSGKKNVSIGEEFP